MLYIIYSGLGRRLPLPLPSIFPPSTLHVSPFLQAWPLHTLSLTPDTNHWQTTDIDPGILTDTDRNLQRPCKSPTRP